MKGNYNHRENEHDNDSDSDNSHCHHHCSEDSNLILDVAVLCQEYSPVEINCNNSHIVKPLDI